MHRYFKCRDLLRDQIDVLNKNSVYVKIISFLLMNL